jgi:CheY-like chemotaxis protein
LVDHASVLVIDDEPDVLSMLALMLSDIGYEVETATSGRQAIALAERRHFDLAVCDLRMPGPDGIATTRGLKALDPEIDVVIATAYASKETRSDCLRNGASDFITKPFTFEALEGVLERVMARRRADD